MTTRIAKLGLRMLGTAAILSLIGPGMARAEDGECLNRIALKDQPAVSLAKVIGGPRVHFANGPQDVSACPNASDACHDESYLVPGDLVIARTQRAGFTCVSYVGLKGSDKSGWLPSASLDPVDLGLVKPEDWVGAWTIQGGGAKVVIRSVRPRGLELHGAATWGSAVRGAVHVGEFEATVVPDGAEVAFARGDFETLPIEKGDDVDCKVWMRRLGPFLIVDDNKECGGVNVSFTGTYRRNP